MDAPYEAVAPADELKPGQMKKISVAGRHLLLANADGGFFVVDEMCSHEDYSLYLGCIQNGKIKCSLHGSYFDLATGNPTTEPADEPLCSYAVKVADGRIWVNPDETNK